MNEGTSLKRGMARLVENPSPALRAFSGRGFSSRSAALRAGLQLENGRKTTRLMLPGGMARCILKLRADPMTLASLASQCRGWRVMVRALVRSTFAARSAPQIRKRRAPRTRIPASFSFKRNMAAFHPLSAAADVVRRIESYPDRFCLWRESSGSSPGSPRALG